MKRKVSNATERILKEIEKHRYMQASMFGAESDDGQVNGELVSAAITYADLSKQQVSMRDTAALYPHITGNGKAIRAWIPPGGTDYGYKVPPHLQKMPASWPFNPSMYIPKAPRYNLIRAAALIVAELERLERLDNKLLNVEKPKPKTKPDFATIWAGQSDATIWDVNNTSYPGPSLTSTYNNSTPTFTVNHSYPALKGTAIGTGNSTQLLQSGTV